MEPVRLRCEHREDVPLLDEPAPRFGWALASGGRDKRQTAYRIRVNAGADTMWDSGRVETARQVDVPYAARPLPPNADLEWAVKVWDEAGEESEWSEPARFRTGLTDGWTARWIARDTTGDPGITEPTDETPTDQLIRALKPVPQFRREFTVAGGVRRAMLYVTARGLVEMHLNGTRIGDAVLAPGWTDYGKRIEYAGHDVTALVRPGANALGALLGDGWYRGFVGFDARRPAGHYGDTTQLLCELHVEGEDGSTQVIGSDEAWRATATGPIAYSDLLHGESYDARDELEGWSEPGFDDSAWSPVNAADRDGVMLVAERGQPIRVTEDLRPISVTEREPGVHVFDMGQNMVGWVRLAVEGERGTTVRLRFAEMLEPDGSLYLDNLRSVRATETYVSRGGGPEVWEPRFTFHGFRYVEATGLPGDVSAEAVTGRVVHSDTPRSGSFKCSHELVNQLWRNADWGQRGNFLSVPTDCPQRDERLGWLADAQVFMPTAMLNMDVAAFLTKWGDDILDAQSPEGAYPDVAPRLVAARDGAPAWADAGIIIPWLMLRRYGDVRLVERNWEAMERYMAHLQRHNPDLLWTARRNNDYGDWLSVRASTPKDVLATAYWAYDAKLMAEMARALGRVDRAEAFERLREGIVAAFNHAYLGDDAYIDGDTQTVYLLALHMDLIADELRPRAAERLVEDIEQHGGHLTTGFVGVGLLCPVLTEAGYPEVAHRLLLNRTFPSWGYSIEQGATTIWERWDGWTEEHGFQTPAMNSFNHYSLGSVGAWLYEYVVGIRPDPARPAYERVLIAPVPGELEWARATYRSVRGEIASAWRRDGDRFELEVTIPPNVTATIVLPYGDGEPVEVGSGDYAFSVAAAPSAAS